MSHWTSELVALGACDPAVEWCRDYDSLRDAWRACERGDWMLWLAGRQAGLRGDIRRRALAACCADVAALALPHASEMHETCSRTLDVVRAWARGDASDKVLREARECAWRNATDATDAAACAADAGGAGATDVAYAAAGTADYAASAAYATARARLLREAADIVRRHYPEPPKLAAVETPWV